MQDYKVVSAPEEIERRLQKAIQEHAALNARVDELGKKEAITPEEEVELKRLRKMKLFKKDMISYLQEMLKSLKR